ncbi:hypothetical protein RB653_009419 [Dictyostelium firmibasis]|uniref:Uncharacterized protein n=1 Tax=Dictyostelium firmibasis TaxID=79012 RepID=A0AAN7U4Y4_9MYCE
MNTKEYYRNKNLSLLFLNFLEASSFASLFIVFYFSESQYATLSIMLFLGSLFFFTRLLIIAFHFHIVWPLLVKSEHLHYNNISDIIDKLNELNNDSNKIIIYFNGKDSNFEKYSNIRLKNLICNQSIISPNIDQFLNNNEFNNKINYINIKFKFNYSNLISNILKEFIKKYPNELIWPNRELIEIENIGFNNDYLLCYTKQSNYSYKLRKVFNILSILFGVSWFYYYFSFYRNSNFKEIIIEKSIDTTYEQLLNDMNYNKVIYNIGKQLISEYNEQFITKQENDNDDSNKIKQQIPQKEEDEILELTKSPKSIFNETVIDIKDKKNNDIVDIVVIVDDVDDVDNDDDDDDDEQVKNVCKEKTLYDLPLIAIESNSPVR